MRKELFLAMASVLSLPGQVMASDPIPTGSCRLVLEAHDVFGDGTGGFQWILDSTHETYDNSFFDGIEFYGDYSEFDYTMPTDAEPLMTTDKVVVDGEVSLIVPAGTYDWMMIHPNGENLVYPFGEYVLADDFPLIEGKTYRMVMEYRDGTKGPGAYATLVTDCDLALTDLVIPRSGVGLTDSEEITVRIANLGMVDMDGVKVCYSVNGGEIVVETLGRAVKTGEILEYTFSRKVDFSTPGAYEVKAYIEVEGDLLSGNNIAGALCRSLTARELPYVCDFSKLGEEGFAEEWMIIDADCDGTAWLFDEWVANKDSVTGVAYCQGSVADNQKNDDWMISMPLRLRSGKNHILFSISSLNDTTPEMMEVCVGKSPYPEDMTPVMHLETCSTDWTDKGVCFEVDNDGVYYVAFHSTSQNGDCQYVGDVVVDAGEFVGVPVVRIKEALVPVSNACLPSDSRIGLRVMNAGIAPLESYTLTAYVNDEEYSQDFSRTILPYETADIYIDKPVDFSTPGKYELRFVVSGENISETVEAEVECLEPISTLPIVTNFTNDINAEIWSPLTENSWIYDRFFMDFSSHAHGLENGLLCRGFNLKYPARIRISYAGGDFGITGFGIYMGKAGEEISTFKRVYFDENVTSDPKEAEFTVETEEPGCYSIVLVDENDDPSSSDHIHLNEATISEVKPYDIRITDIDSPISSYIPERQIGGSKLYVVDIENRGFLPMTGIKVEASVDGEKVFISEEIAEIAPGETQSVAMSFVLPQKHVGDSFTLSFAAEGDHEDGHPADNHRSLPIINVTEETCAFENLDTPEYGTGGNGVSVAIGNVYTFTAPADLTAIEVGLSPTEEDSSNAMGDIAFNIYSLGSGKSIDRKIYSEVRKRGVGGIVTLDIPDMRLAPGSYYIEVEQMSTYNMGLAYDPESPAICYMRDGEKLVKMEFRAVCVRALFGEDAKVYPTDGSATKIISPSYLKGIYGKDTSVAGIVRNSGYEDAQVEVSLSVDGVRLGSRVIPMMSYEDAEVSFDNVDLSLPGVHRIELKATAEGDLNPDNDICVLEIEVAEELSPYVMDFEGCNDFDASGDMWNPRWTTVDRNGVATTAFWHYNHKHKEDACGFMAFNPDATVPSMIETEFKGMYPYEGERLGLAFTPDPFAEGGADIEESDIWIISPKLLLGSGSEFEVYVKTRDLEGYDSELEPYRILVSDSGEAPECFKVVEDDIRLAPVEEWEKVTADLSHYDGKEVYVALQYIGKPFINTCLMIDNLRINTKLSGVSSVNPETQDVKVVGNTIIAPEGSRIFTISGVETGNTGLDKGIYIVRTPTGTCKVIIR